MWDASGRHLYFLASTNYGLNTGWLDMTSYDRPVTRALYLALLEADERSPFLPRSDEEEVAVDNEAAEGSAEGGDGDDVPVVAIDVEGIDRRIVAAPGLPLKNYAGLLPGPAGSVFVLEVEAGATSGKLRKYSVEDREATDFVEPVFAAEVSHDRKHLIYRSGSAWRVVGTEQPPSGDDGTLDLAGMRVHVEPTAEYAQMLRDGWRFMRDFLYVDNQHGAPWDEVWDWYSAWLPDVRHRADFNQLLDMLSGEIAVGHSYVFGGDLPDLDNPRTGLLGADLEEAEGFYRIARIYDGDPWTPGEAGPLSLPGLEVAEGDYLIAVDGAPLRPPGNPYRLLEGTAGRTITLTISSSPSADEARDVVVEPVPNESDLRIRAWVAANQARVDELSGGRLAYLWLPNTARDGYEYFNRMYYAQQDREGAVIDERNNGGGSAADYIVDMLDRELTGYFNSRAGDRKPWTQPMAGLFGPKVMIVNESAGSGGDLLPYLFRFRGIGPLVGTRTWGGLVGSWDTPPLIDGGFFVAPRGGFFDVNGEWAVEGEGVAPDIEVRNDPAPVIAGRDPQLEAAVEEALRLLETEGVALQGEPPPPVRWPKFNSGRTKLLWNQQFTPARMLEWHYKRAQTGKMGRSDGGLADASRLRVDAERVVDGPLSGFGLRGGAHVQGTSVGAPEGGGDALLAFEDAAQRGPTGVLAVGSQPGADDLHELVGDDGDEQVAIGPPRLLVVDGAQSEFGLQGTEDGLDIGEGGVGAPQGVFVPVGLAAAQAIDAWMGGHRAVLGPSGPSDGGGLLTSLVGGDLDLVVLGDAGMLGSQSPDALPDLSEALVGAGARQPLVERGQGGLEAGGGPLDDGPLLVGPLFGVAVQADLAGVGRDHLVQMHGLVRLRADRHGGIGVELPVAFAADDQIAVAVVAQPPDGGFGGDAAVHDHQGAGRRVERLQHTGQRAVLADVTGEDL